MAVVSRRSLVGTKYFGMPRTVTMARRTFEGEIRKSIIFPSGMSIVFSTGSRGEVGYLPTNLAESGICKVG